MSKISEAEREKLIIDLNALYKENLKFIEDVRSGNTKRNYKEEKISNFEKLNLELKEYIEDIENGLDANKTVEDWCLFLGDTLLDDDNFYVEEDGFSWH